MKALIRFTGATSFEKKVDIIALPDVGEAVRVLDPSSTDESGRSTVVAGVVTARTFSEWPARLTELGVIIDVQQA